ncbi:MAG: O-antigen ligase family protein [Lentimonas sp.]
MPKAKLGKPIWRAYLFGFIGVCVLLAMGHNLFAYSFALILPGLALCIRPPKNGLGKWFDYGLLGFLVCIVFAFLPQFYWPTADWRLQAVNDYGIDLPSVLSVHPWISFEATILVVAGICWFYVASGWGINARGRKLFYFAISLAMAVFAGVIIWGNYYNVRSFIPGDSLSIGMLADQTQLGSLLALGGIISFGFAIEGLRVRDLMHIFGLITSALCLIALAISESAIGVVVFLLGVSIWYLIRSRSKSLPPSFKVVFPVIVAACCLYVVVNDQARGRVVDAVDASSERLQVYQDTAQMFLGAPILGTGIRTFESVFPQHREHSRSAEIIEDARSDALLLLAELGILGLVCVAIILRSYFKHCRGLSLGRGGGFRVIAMVSVVAFLLHSLIDVPGHRPAAIYFVLLLAAFSLPARGAATSTLKPVLWRLIGAFLLLIGMIWGFAGLTTAPFHSSTALVYYEETAQEHADAVDYGSAIASIDTMLAWNPTLWRAYYKRAKYGLGLKSDVVLVDEDFKRARFIEPILGAFSVDEGFAWLPRYVERAVFAWEQALSREIDDKDQAYVSMLKAGLEDLRLMDAMLALSKMDPHYRTITFRYLEGSLFNREIGLELSADPALDQFTAEQRFTIIKKWIQYGDLDAIATFLAAHGKGVQHVWWLQSLMLKERTDFEEAVQSARKGLFAPVLPEVKIEAAALTRMAREFAIAPDDTLKGTTLLSAYIEADRLELGLEVTDAMLETQKAPAYVHYWRAEILYRMEDIIESWYAFRDYILLEFSDDFSEAGE